MTDREKTAEAFKLISASIKKMKKAEKILRKQGIILCDSLQWREPERYFESNLNLYSGFDALAEKADVEGMDDRDLRRYFSAYGIRFVQLPDTDEDGKRIYK